MNGILLLDKPEGWTSMDVCAKLRGALQERKIGHAGTLDPMATGLLEIFLGRATRAVEFAERQEKTYEAALRLGLVTDTQDVTGRVLERHEVDITQQQLEDVLIRFRGEQEQLPPMYSAVKVNGQKLYQLARKGREVERRPRRIVIHELELTGRAGEDWLLRIRCSKGTYIRTLCHDIGAALGCGGTMSALRRTAADRFSVRDAHTLPEVLEAAGEGRAEALLLPVDTLFRDRARLTLTPGQERAIRTGGYFSTAAEPGEYRLYAQDGAFLALGLSADGRIRAIKSFFEVGT